MATRAWTVWGVGAALVGGLAASAKPPELPGNPQVDGRVPPPLTQDHHQVEALPPPRLLPLSVLDPNPRHGPERAEGPATDLNTPIRATLSVPAVIPFDGSAVPAADLVTVVAFLRAEAHFDACEVADAKRWYQVVISRAPRSHHASIARERLLLGKVIPAGAVQSREPPLADPNGLPKPIPATANGPID